jgi:hypothetical protein
LPEYRHTQLYLSAFGGHDIERAMRKGRQIHVHFRFSGIPGVLSCRCAKAKKKEVPVENRNLHMKWA